MADAFKRDIPLTLCCAAFLCVAGVLSGCGTVPVHRQGQLAQSAMQFDHNSLLAFEGRVVALLEPGVSSSGGGSATGCSSCK